MRYLKPQKPQTNLMGIYLNPAVRLSTRVDAEEGNITKQGWIQDFGKQGVRVTVKY